MIRFFRGGSLAVHLRMSSMAPRAGVLTSLLAGLTLSAQVQAQEAQRQLVITNVDVDYDKGQMIIHGRNFATPTGASPLVQFMEMGMTVVTYGPYTIVAALPPAFQRAGSYLLTVSTGPNLDQHDSCLLYTSDAADE